MQGPSAELFNSIASDPIYKFEQVLEALAISQGESIADIGSGGGFYALKFARLVGSTGQVFAIDIRADFLEYIKKDAQQQNISNINLILSVDNSFALPEKILDLVFIRNVCHHLEDRAAFFLKLKPFLKSQGRTAVIDYTPEGNRQGHGPPGHFVDPPQLRQEMTEAGFQQIQELTFLPGQFFKIFK